MPKADNLPPYRAVVMKSGSPNFLEPSGPAQACYGRTLSFLLYLKLYSLVHSIYRQVQHPKFFVPPGEYATCFCVPQNKERIFPCTELTDWLSKTQTECVYRAGRTETLYIIQGNHCLTVICVLWTLEWSLFKWNTFAAQVTSHDYVLDMSPIDQELARWW